MLHRIYGYFPVLLLWLVACKPAPTPTEAIDQTCSSLTESSDGLRIKNQYFKHLQNGSVLAIVQDELIGDTISLPKTLISPVYPKADSGKWQIECYGQEVKFFNDLVIAEAIRTGNDASYKVFNLNNGNEIIAYTYDKFDILFSDENEKRFLGFYGMNASDKKDNPLKFEALTFGFLSFSNKDGLLGQIRIDTKDPMWLDVLDISNPVIELVPIKGNALSLNSGKTLYFTSSDGKKGDDVNFDIQITFYTTDTYKPITFMLQVRNDKFELAKDFSNTVFHLESL